MSNDNGLVIRLCGEYPEGFEPINLESNPDFIFTNDPAYEIVKLYDYDENSVFVNSFIECEHYVSGGWGFNQLINNELFYQEIFIYLVIFGIIITFLKPKIIKYIKN